MSERRSEKDDARREVKRPASETGLRCCGRHSELLDIETHLNIFKISISVH